MVFTKKNIENNGSKESLDACTIGNKVIPIKESSKEKPSGLAKFNAKRTKHKEVVEKKRSHVEVKVHEEISEYIDNIEEIIEQNAIIFSQKKENIINNLNRTYSRSGIEGVLNFAKQLTTMPISQCRKFANYYDMLAQISDENKFDLLKAYKEEVQFKKSFIQFDKAEPIFNDQVHWKDYAKGKPGLSWYMNQTSEFEQVFTEDSKAIYRDVKGACSSKLTGTIRKKAFNFEVPKQAFKYTDLSKVSLKKKANQDELLAKILVVKRILAKYPLVPKNLKPIAIPTLEMKVCNAKCIGCAQISNCVHCIDANKIEFRGCSTCSNRTMNVEKYMMCALCINNIQSFYEKDEYISILPKPLIEKPIFSYFYTEQLVNQKPIDSELAIAYLQGKINSVPSHVDPYCSKSLQGKVSYVFDRSGNTSSVACLSFDPQLDRYISIAQMNVNSKNKSENNIKALKPKIFCDIEEIVLTPSIENTDLTEYREVKSQDILSEMYERTDKLLALNPKLKNINKMMFKQIDNCFSNGYFGLDISQYIERTKIERIPIEISYWDQLADQTKAFLDNKPVKQSIICSLDVLEKLSAVNLVVKKARTSQNIPADLYAKLKKAKELNANFTNCTDAAIRKYWKVEVLMSTRDLKKLKNVIFIKKPYLPNSFDLEIDSIFNKPSKFYRDIDVEVEDTNAKYSELFLLKQARKDLINDEVSLDDLQKQAVFSDIFSNGITSTKALKKAINNAIAEKQAQLKKDNNYWTYNSHQDKTQKDDFIRGWNYFVQTLNNITDFKLVVEKSADMKKISYNKVPSKRRERVMNTEYNQLFYNKDERIDMMRQRSLIDIKGKIGRPQGSIAQKILFEKVLANLSKEEKIDMDLDLIEDMYNDHNQIGQITQQQIDQVLEYGAKKGIISYQFTFKAIRLTKLNEIMDEEKLQNRASLIKQTLEEQGVKQFIVKDFNEKDNFYNVMLASAQTIDEYTFKEKMHAQKELDLNCVKKSKLADQLVEQKTMTTINLQNKDNASNSDLAIADYMVFNAKEDISAEKRKEIFECNQKSDQSEAKYNENEPIIDKYIQNEKLKKSFLVLYISVNKNDENRVMKELNKIL